MEKVKGALYHLGAGWSRLGTTMTFDENVWEDMARATFDTGMNTIFLDIHEGLHYGSHPELAVPDAWTRQRMRREIKRFKENGVTICPKLNFSTCHDSWLLQYERMVSTPEYYRVCRELIMELSDLFRDAPYFHVGLDEEDVRHARNQKYPIFRRGELLWHDIQFFLDCVRDCDKTPVMWSSLVNYEYEDFRKNVDPEDLIIMYYYYHGVRPEHWWRTDVNEENYNWYFVKGDYVGQNLEYVERDDPYYIHFRKNALKSVVEDGYDAIMCVSNVYGHPHNEEDVVEMLVNEWPADKLKGIITAPWQPTIEKYHKTNVESVYRLKKAFDKYGY